MASIQEPATTNVTEDAPRGYLLGATTAMAIDNNPTQSEPDVRKAIEDDEDDIPEGLTSQQKCALGFIWFISGVYSVLSDQILTKERDVQCSLRNDVNDKFNFISLFIAIAIPLGAGPLFCPLGHFILRYSIFTTFRIFSTKNFDFTILCLLFKKGFDSCASLLI